MSSSHGISSPSPPPINAGNSNHSLLEFERIACDPERFFLQYPPFVGMLFKESGFSPNNAGELYEFFNVHLPAIIAHSPSHAMHIVTLQIYHPDMPEKKHKFVVKVHNDPTWFTRLLSAVQAVDICGADGKTSISSMNLAQIHRESCNPQGCSIVIAGNASSPNQQQEEHPMLSAKNYKVPRMYHGKGEYYLRRWWFNFITHLHDALLLQCLFNPSLKHLIQDINGYGLPEELHKILIGLLANKELYEDKGATSNFQEFLHKYLHVTSTEQVKLSQTRLVEFIHSSIIEPLHFILRTVMTGLMWVWGYNLRMEHRIEHKPLEVTRKELNEGFLTRVVDVVFQYGTMENVTLSIENVLLLVSIPSSSTALSSSPSTTTTATTTTTKHGDMPSPLIQKKERIIASHEFLASKVISALEEEVRFTVNESSIPDPILQEFAHGICPSYFDHVLTGNPLTESQRKSFLSSSLSSSSPSSSSSSVSQPQIQLLTMYHNLGEYSSLTELLNYHRKNSPKLRKLESLLRNTAEKNPTILKQRHLMFIPKDRKFDPRQDYFVLPAVLSTKHTDDGNSLLMILDGDDNKNNKLAIDPIPGIFLEMKGGGNWTARNNTQEFFSAGVQEENGMIVHYIWE